VNTKAVKKRLAALAKRLPPPSDEDAEGMNIGLQDEDISVGTLLGTVRARLADPVVTENERLALEELLRFLEPLEAAKRAADMPMGIDLKVELESEEATR
jgi:hypothetical protein